MLKNIIVLFWGLFLAANGYSKILIVNNLADSNPDSWRKQTVSAVPSDINQINIKGILDMTFSPILIDKELTNQGSTVSYLKVDVNNQNLDFKTNGLLIEDILTATSTKIVSANYEWSDFPDTIMVRAPFLVTIIDSTDVLCNGAANGRLEVSVTGGSYPPYSYQWYLIGSGPITGANSNVYFAGPGTYTCQVTDAISAVVFSDTATIAQPPLLTVTSTVNNTLCNLSCDGSIVLSQSGGTPPYQYSIDNGSFYQGTNTFLNLCSNIYQIVVQDANGCLTTNNGNSVIVNSPPAISISSNFTSETCSGFNDGTITVSANGGTGLFTYRIDAGVYGAGSFFGGLTPGNHIVEVSDATGCTSNISVNILAGNLVTANFSVSSTNACQNDFDFNFTDLSTSSASSIALWNWTFPSASPSSASIANVSGVAFFNSGVNNVTLAVTASDGCIGTVVLPVTVNPAVFPDVGIDSTICVGTSFTQVGNVLGGTAPFTYSWTPAGNFVASNIEDAVVTGTITSAPGAYSHTLNVVDANGCTGTDFMSLTINDLPSVSAPADYSLCQGATTSLVGSGTAITYSWDNSVVDGTPFNPSSTLTYTVTGTDEAGCQNTDQVTITTLVAPVANAGVDNTICVGQTYTLDGSSSTGTIINYSWNEVGVGNISSGTSPITTVNPIATTSYALKTDNGICLDFDTITLSVISAPSAVFNYSNTSFCNNAPDELPTFVATSGGTFLLPTSPGSINAATGNINFSTLAPGIYTVIHNITTPCFASDSISLTIFALPTVNAGNDTSICAGDIVSLNGSGSGSIFNWSNNLGFNSTINPTSDSLTTTDTYTFNVTDVNGCSNFDSKMVTVNPIPSGTISGGGAFCEGDLNASLTVTANGYSGAGDWNNQFFQNSAPGAIATPPTGTYTLNGLGNTIYNGVWTAVITDNLTGCIGNANGNVTINVNPDPTMSVTSPVNACSGSVPFNMNTNFIPSISGGTWSGVGVTGTNFNPISTGVGTFDVIYTTSVGCDDTVTINVQAAPNPTITGLNSAYCINDAAFTPTGSPAGGIWSIDGAPFTTITTIDPSTFSAGTHSLSYQFTDVNTGCVGTTTPNLFVISLVPLDPVAVSNTNQSICGGGSLVLTVSNPNTGGTTIQWYSDTALTINVGSTINFTTPFLTGSINYYAVAQNTGCKSNPVIFSITVNNPQVSAGPDVTICPGTPAQLNLTSASGSISWSPGISLSDSTIQNPIATPNVSTTYYVTVTSGPCLLSDSVNVIIDGSNPDCGIVPSYNAFSPDNDGVNDTWIIDAIFAHLDNIVTIYNRWGDKLVSFDDYDNVNVVWDGKYKGEILPSGTYFYVVEYLDIKMQVSGWLQLTR